VTPRSKCDHPKTTLADAKARTHVVQPIGGVDRAEEYKLEQRKRYTVLRRANASHYLARFGHVSKRRGERSILPMVQHLEISR